MGNRVQKISRVLALFSAAVLPLLLPVHASAEEPTKTSLQTVELANKPRPTWQTEQFEGLEYRLLMPENFDPAEHYPILLFLHGSGDDIDQTAPEPLVAGQYFGDARFREQHQAIVIAPQCPGSIDFMKCNWGGFNSKVSPQEQKVVDLVNTIARNAFVDSNRIYVTGLSLGGISAWDLISRYPQLFAAALPIAGGAFSAEDGYDQLLVDKPIWAAHGADDPTVAPDLNRQHTASIQNLGGKRIRYTEYPGMQHNVWDIVYSDAQYMDWLFSQSLSRETNDLGANGE